MKVKAPTILAFLEACVSRSSALDSNVVVGVCAAILAKAQRPAASLFQHIISIILNSGHCGKKVLITYMPPKDDTLHFTFKGVYETSKAWDQLIELRYLACC